ncbi:efflux transporter outer membrane subunit [Flavisphingomonas formosensis]|uniref:efflux transporter outer membrane subunit n=1 Tax=Flavisphingomonas formosensis TaxID=861534 RepID=UPI0012F9E594|nr:efflux transporter outer membrane subunit [Sphingomonas formosensis]
MARASALLLLLTLGACTVGPSYREPPKVAAAPAWVEPGSSDPVDVRWWESFGDPTLARLIADADAANLDIRSARARLAEARADRASAAAGLLPQVNASGSATTNRLSENGQIPIGKIPGFSRDLDLYDVGFDASWEIDLWGKTRRTIEGAEARMAAADADRRATMVSVHAEVARSYIDLRAAQALHASLKSDADAQAKIADLTRQRFRAGEASRFDAERADGEARSTAAQLPGAEADVHAAAYRLALLTGRPPEGLDPKLLEPAPIPSAPDVIARGLRSDLLRRRPDIVSAERRLAAATADIGVATADLFPSFSLLGSIGQQGRSPGDLTANGSMRYQFGPTLHWPIFDAGRIRAQIRGAKARAEGAAAAYEAAVLGALSDSETAANRFARAGGTRAQSRAARDAQRAALDLARQRYRAGEADLIELLTVETAYLTAERAAIDAESARSDQAIALYKALGGGA